MTPTSPIPKISAPHHAHTRTTVHLDGTQVWESVHAASVLGDRTVCGEPLGDRTEPGGLTCPRCVTELETGTDRLIAAVVAS